MQTLLNEYFRPWKLATFTVGLGLLLIGADLHIAPDWDYPISFLMATLTYLTAPWSVRVFKDRRWQALPVALFWFYFTVDGCYWLYWSTVKPEALVMREANLYASSCLYWLCGFIWLHDGPLRSLLVRQAKQREIPPERITARQMLSRIAITVILFWLAYFIYSMATGKERMTELCRQISPGTGVEQLMRFAERHGLQPRRLKAETRLAYLAETRTMGRHACRVELDGGKVKEASYNFAD